MKTIYKYDLPIQDEVTLSIPGGFGDIVHVGLDPGGIPSVWILVDNAYSEKSFTLYVVGTGRLVSYYSDHVGSFVDGSFVWHVFKPK